jgi:hypothetical protein
MRGLLRKHVSLCAACWIGDSRRSAADGRLFYLKEPLKVFELLNWPGKHSVQGTPCNQGPAAAAVQLVQR